MASAFRYRAVGSDGAARSGTVEAPDMAQALAGLRGSGATVVELRPAPAGDARPSTVSRRSAEADGAATLFVGELAVLLRAGLPLDRALALAIENIEPRRLAPLFAGLLPEVREGRTLAAAMTRAPALFAPAAIAMTEAGEASGRLDEALSRLAEMLDRAAELRKLIRTSMIYPAALAVIAVGVILMMLLFVVPQFESLLSGTRGDLPAASRAVLGASALVRSEGHFLLIGIVGAVAAARYLLARRAARQRVESVVLTLPVVGELVKRMETARFARTLGALVASDVPLPSAVALARRTIGNSVMSGAVDRIARQMKEGGGLGAPLAASGLFPTIAVGFIRTGEESSQLGLMLDRLADVLDRDVKLRLQRLVAILTPAITVVLGAVVAGIIAAIMSAILGFNALAVTQ